MARRIARHSQGENHCGDIPTGALWAVRNQDARQSEDLKSAEEHQALARAADLEAPAADVTALTHDSRKVSPIAKPIPHACYRDASRRDTPQSFRRDPPP